MAALNFPSSPTLNQTYTANGKTYLWNGTSWVNTTSGYTGSRGAIGYTGSAGPTGPQGSIGYTGSQGAQGATGPQGLIGYTGSAGPQGPQGAQGATGPQGSIGYTGSAGPTGPQGPQGAQGATGPTGPQGAIGYTGSAGPQGPQGATGPQGPIGYTGSQGAQGPTGPQGLIGYTGSAGPQGAQGPTGPQGPIGYTGSQGAQGPQGPIGYTGSWGGTALANVNMNGFSINNANVINAADLSLTGNLTVSGTTTYINTTNLNVGDSIVTLNADLTGATAPTENSGIEINRGSSANVQFIWDETNDRWSTNTQPIALGNTTVSGWSIVSSARGGVAAPTLGQNNSAFIVTNSDNGYGVLFGTNPSTGDGWIQAQRVDGTATAYKLRLNPSGGAISISSNTEMSNNFLIAPTLKAYSEDKSTNSSATGTVTLDLSTTNVFDLTLTGATTLAFSNPPPNTRVFSFTIIAKQDATGGRTITWPASKKFAGGVSPPPTTAANAIDIWSVMTYDGGTSYIVSLSVKDAK